MNLPLNNWSVVKNFALAKYSKLRLGALMALGVIGLFTIVMSVVSLSQGSSRDDWKSTMGRVEAVSQKNNDQGIRFNGIIHYQVEGKNYVIEDPELQTIRPRIGSPKEVFYKSTNPNEAVFELENSFPVWSLLGVIFGLALSGVSGYMLFKKYQRQQFVNKLVKDGTKLNGVLSDVLPDSQAKNADLTIDYRLTVSTVDILGNARSYISDRVSGPAGISLASFRSNPIPIDVYVDAMNPDDYYVDLSEIPELTPLRIAQMIQNARVNSGQASFEAIDQSVASAESQ